MMSSLSRVALLCALFQLVASDCAPNNCIRAVTGTARQMSDMKYNDCQSYMLCTVTPVASESTVTVTATAKVLAKGDARIKHKKRAHNMFQRQASTTPEAITNCPTAVPSYASACSDSVRYSSACSCWGVTLSTTTTTATTLTTTSTLVVMPPPSSNYPVTDSAPPPSSDTTTMMTSVVSATSETYTGSSGTTVVNIPTPTQFITLKVVGGSADGHGLSYSTDGKIGVGAPGMDSTNGIFYMDADDHLRNTRDPDGASFVPGGYGAAALSFTPGASRSVLNCTVATDYMLDCDNTPGYTAFRICQNYLYVTAGDYPIAGANGTDPCAGEVNVKLKAMYLSG